MVVSESTASLTRPSAGYAVEVCRDVRIPTTDPAVTLSASLYRPRTAGAVPALVTLLPYRADASAGIAADASMHWFAERGYACLLVDFRGIGSSDGRQRQPFDPAEADDGVAAVEWAAEQAWCTGKVGMWGHSYGAVLSLRTAALRPPHLRSILPIMGFLDPERDFVHPAGEPGCLAPVASWGLSTLLNQLLPPLFDHRSEAQLGRWRARLDNTEPWILDLARRGPGDPVWRARAIDPSTITVPAFCVAGWRDLFCEGMIRGYESISAPKTLLVGPWMHTRPESSPFDPVDFWPLALRWWDHWLLDIDTGFMDEPAVTLFEQGAHGGPRWRQFGTWPPSTADFQLMTAGGTTLETGREDGQRECAVRVVAERTPDPTLGPLGGLWGIPTGGFGLPADQQEEDTRGITCTSQPLERDLVLAGRCVITVYLAEESTVDRLVVQVTDVDPDGRSTLITSGVVPLLTKSGPLVVRATPTCYRLPRGHRFRVVVGDADFPRLWPASHAVSAEPILRLTHVVARIPVVPDHDGRIVGLRPPTGAASAIEPLALSDKPQWTITRDLIDDAVTVVVGREQYVRTPGRDHTLATYREATAHIARAEPANAEVHAVTTGTARMSTGETIVARAEIVMTRSELSVHGEIRVDGVTTFSRRWHSRAN